MKEILGHTISYLEKVISNFQSRKMRGVSIFTCPSCSEISARLFLQDNSYLISCVKCNYKGTVIDFVIEKEGVTEEEAVIKIKQTLGIDYITPSDCEKILDFYSKNNFDLVPVIRNEKKPIEDNWPEIEHKNREDWKRWIGEEYNIGIKCGEKSGITVIDVDITPIPEDLKKLLPEDTLIQFTNKGFHYFFKYEKDFPNWKALKDLHIEIYNSRHVLSCPSVFDNKRRNMNFNEIKEMPKVLKDFLLSKIKIKEEINYDEPLKEIDNFRLPILKEGDGRNNLLISYGGILLKDGFNLTQIERFLNLVNRSIFEPMLPEREIKALMRNLNKYKDIGDREIQNKILQYLRIVEEASSRDLRDGLGYQIAQIEKALNTLIKEGYVLKKGRTYYVTQKADWQVKLLDLSKEIDFKMPYLGDAAIFRDGDMIIIGAKSGTGKSHIAMNIIKRLVQQGKTPYYISLESGNRFQKIALELGLKEGDFQWCIHFNPERVELEDNAITIIDWILPEDYSQTDKIYKYFAQQLVKHNGLLIVFCQLRQDGEFFAKNMLDFFASLTTKFLYKHDDDRTESYFETDKIREAKFTKNKVVIPCRYDFGSKQLKTLEEIEESKNGQKS